MTLPSKALFSLAWGYFTHTHGFHNHTGDGVGAGAPVRPMLSYSPHDGVSIPGLSLECLLYVLQATWCLPPPPPLVSQEHQKLKIGQTELTSFPICASSADSLGFLKDTTSILRWTAGNFSSWTPKSKELTCYRVAIEYTILSAFSPQPFPTPVSHTHNSAGHQSRKSLCQVLHIFPLDRLARPIPSSPSKQPLL